jgi:exodeoxyribonuclease-3
MRLRTPSYNRSNPMKIATWNVNGIRARESQMQEWVEREHPDIVCLQEIKAVPDQIPAALCEMEGYWCYWHGTKGYSGVGLHVSKAFSPERPAFGHPAFDYESRIVTATVQGVTFASIYVPNGGKDFPAKMAFLESLREYTAALHAGGQRAVLCGDLNIARAEIDVHPKEKKPRAIGQLPEERALLERIIGNGLVDTGRALEPENDQMFTWWPPWRDMKARNIGWRLDYVLASESIFAKVESCAIQREFGTSDHGPVVATFSGFRSFDITTSSGKEETAAPQDSGLLFSRGDPETGVVWQGP